jgi:hypothetical protein
VKITAREVSPAQARSLEVLAALERTGLLLKQDKHLPSVVTLLAGAPLSSSWWSHPDSRSMFRVLSELSHHPDVLLTKLLLAKDTFVHRTLWPAFLAVASAREPWQVAGLSGPARRLLASIDRTAASVRSTGAAAKELIARLLVHATEFHTDEGRHEIALQSWSAWRAQADIVILDSVDDARRALEDASHRLGAPPTALPWRAAKPSRANAARAVRAVRRPRRTGRTG